MRERDVTQPKFKTNPPKSNREGIKPLGFLTIVVGNNTGQTYSLRAGTVRIGRGSHCEIQLTDTQVSRQHLELTVGNDEILLRDLKTTNGSFINGKTLTEVVLKHGDEITLGLTTLQFLTAHGKDPLAGIEHVHDHDFFAQRLTEEIDRSHRFQRPLSIMMLHIVDEKLPLRELVPKLREHLRTMDLLAIYSRFDLEVMLPETEKEDARKLASQILKDLRKLTDLKVGLATYPVDATNRDQIIELSRVPIWMENSGSREISDRKSRAEAAAAAELIDQKIILHSPKMRTLYQTAMQIAPSPISVLIQGETGTGKELVAEVIHNHSERQGKPFMAINCGAFTPTLLESELFGHERGSFTGAEQRKIGLIEATKGGTLFMDEIGEIPPPLQVKLLRVLQENSIRRVGGNENIKVNFRVVSATNKNLRKMVEVGTFREDFYYRLNAIILEVPPLRERLDEIPHLAQFFLKQFKQAYRKPDIRFSPAALETLAQHPWPGNVRELKNCVERAVVISATNNILPENLNLLVSKTSGPQPQIKFHTDATISGEMRTLLDEYEKQLLINALQKTGWNQTKASELLKIPRRTLVSKLKKYGIQRSEG